MISAVRLESGFSRSSKEGIEPKVPMKRIRKKKPTAPFHRKNFPKFLLIVSNVLIAVLYLIVIFF
jgi:hypothetical protein